LLAYELAGPSAGAVLGTALTIKMVMYVVIAPLAAAYADRLPRRLFLTLLAVAVSAPAAVAQTPDERREALSGMIPTNPDGQIGALAPQNLNAERPEPGFNLTGTWFVDLSEGFGNFRFGPPYPEFTGQTKEDFEYGLERQSRGEPWRDAIGQCFPPGLPMMMTRVWPIAMVQLPTVIYMVSNFNNNFRQIFLDGRDHSDPDEVIFTYNGESIGRWEGDTLVVDTKYIEPYNNFIDTGIPISDEFEVTERIRLIEDGEVLEIEYIMNDPHGWEGEWRNTKQCCAWTIPTSPCWP
jgi:hypothetical protein